MVKYPDRDYVCPACGHRGPSYSVKQASPPEFFLQPHDMYPMRRRDFKFWLTAMRTHLPDSEKLRDLGISWYPGTRRAAHDDRLDREIVMGPRYLLRFYPRLGLEERPIHVFAQGMWDLSGEAIFSIDPSIELVRNVYGFDESELERIREFISEHEAKIRAAWPSYRTYVENCRAEWLAILDGVAEGDGPSPRPWWRKNWLEDYFETLRWKSAKLRSRRPVVFLRVVVAFLRVVPGILREAKAPGGPIDSAWREEGIHLLGDALACLSWLFGCLCWAGVVAWLGPTVYAAVAVVCGLAGLKVLVGRPGWKYRAFALGGTVSGAFYLVQHNVRFLA